MTKEGRDSLTRWGKIVAILAGLIVLASGLMAAGDDRYVKRVDYEKDMGQIKSDTRVIRAAICSDRPQACQE